MRLLFIVCAAINLLLPAVSFGAGEVAHEPEAYGGLLTNLVARVRLWPELAPGETNACCGRFAFDARLKGWRRHDVTCPTLMVYSGASHGLSNDVNVRGWQNRILDWLASRGF